MLGGYIMPAGAALAMDDSSPEPAAAALPPPSPPPSSPSAELLGAVVKVPTSAPSPEVRCAFGLFLGFGQTSPRSSASAFRRSNSTFVGLPRFFLGGSIGPIVTGPGNCCGSPLIVWKAGGRG